MPNHVDGEGMQIGFFDVISSALKIDWDKVRDLIASMLDPRIRPRPGSWCSSLQIGEKGSIGVGSERTGFLC